MAGQIQPDPFAGSLSDPGIDPFEVPEAPPEQTTRAGQARTSAMPVPGPISPDRKLPPENLYSRMRSNVINALGLNNPALTTPQPNPAYSPTVAKAADAIHQGLGALDKAIPPEARMIGSMFPADLAEAPIWGAAKLAKGVTEYQPWREEMVKDADPSIDQHLPWIWDESKKILNRHAAQAPLNELGEPSLPNLQHVVDQYNKGIEGQDWYLNTRPELEKQFGPDTDLFINMLAATSPNNTVPANLTQAVKAYKAYKSGVPFELVHPGWMKDVTDNLNRVVRKEPISGQKITNFAKNLRGETEPVTVDRWMMRALGMPEGHPDNPTTYKFADYWLSQIAHDMGVEPRQLQAAIWKTAREVGGQSAATGQPFETMLAQNLAKNPSLNAVLNRVRQGAPQSVIQQAPSREQIITSLLPKWKKTAPTPALGTMEVATRQTPAGEEAANLYDRLGGMDQSQPWVEELKRGYEGAQQNAFDALAMPQGKQPSLLSQLRSAITGDPKSIDDTIATRGTSGTFENEINPNIQFSMEGMTEPQRHAMLSILGKHFNQAASAASHFEAIPKTDPMYANPDTYSVFLYSHPDQQAIKQFSNRVGFPINVRRYNNGTMLDLNTGGMDSKPGLDQVDGAARATFPQQRRHILPRRYSGDYIPQEQYQEKINGYLQQGPHAGTEEATGPAPGLRTGPVHVPGGAGRPGRAGNPPQSLSNIRAQIEAVAQAKEKAFGDWARETQARLRSLGYARGGAVTDGGWFGQNAPSGSLRMADGGWNDPALWQPQPNPAYGEPGERATNAQKILGPWLGGKLNSIAQGAIDPVVASLQLANRAIPGANQQAVDERLRNYREQYKQSLPGGQEDWTNQGLRFLSSGATAAEMVPETRVVTGLGRNLPGILGKAVPGLLSRVASGAPSGAMYGALVPKETPQTFQETARQAALGAAGGVGEEFLAPPIERGIAGLMTKLGVSPPTASKIAEQAAWRASDALPDPSIPDMRVASGVEHEAEAEAATLAAQEANPLAHAIARRITHAAGDAADPANFANRTRQPSWQPPSPPTPLTPDRQDYDPLSDPLLGSGEPYAGGGLYGQMRRASLRALKGAR